MNMRLLGSGGIEVSALGMGCTGITHASGDPVSDVEAIAIIRAAREAGRSLFDMAERYVGTRSDGTLGRGA